MGNLLDQVVEKENMEHALRTLNQNACAGIDGMKVKRLKGQFPDMYETLKCKILDGKYKPIKLLRTYIPKGNAQYRMLSIPAAVDRLIQASIVQVLSPIYQMDFSEFSYGFIKDRGCYPALLHALNEINKGKTHIIKIDLKKFFDNVPHDTLMQILRKKIQDEELLKLIYKYLITKALIPKKGTVAVTKGVPQGGPLSPLLSNIFLNELDQFLQDQNITFSRYADDCIILCGSEWEACCRYEKVITFIEQDLNLEINYKKSNVCDASKIEFLGYTFKKIEFGYVFDVADERITDLKDRMLKIIEEYYEMVSNKDFVQKLMELTRGWINYYYMAGIEAKLADVDKWFRETITEIHKYDKEVYLAECRELRHGGMTKAQAYRTANADRKMAGKTVIQLNIPIEKYYGWLLDTGYKPCTELLRRIRKKRKEI